MQITFAIAEATLGAVPALLPDAKVVFASSWVPA